MPLVITHPFVSTVTEGPGSGTAGGPVGPTEWNAQHTISGALSATQVFGSSPLPGDALIASGVTLGAVHSMARQLVASYNGKLFQVRRVSDSATLDIGIASDGWADVTSLNNFLSATTGFVVTIYDQSGKGNNLTQSTNGNQGALNIRNSQLGRQVPVVSISSGQFYRKRSGTTGIPTGANPITIYAVVTNQIHGVSIGFYGDVETTVVDNGNGHMFSVSCGSSGTKALGVDLENNVVEYGNDQEADFIGMVAKSDGVSTLTLKGGPATSLIVTTVSPGTGLPVGWKPLALEGGISLGEGGDGTPGPQEFVEGIIGSGQSTDAADQVVQNNLAYAFGGSGGLQQYGSQLETQEPILLLGTGQLGTTTPLQFNYGGPTFFGISGSNNAATVYFGDITTSHSLRFQFGGADTATPNTQIFTAPNARPGTDTNIAGNNLRFIAGVGTGTGTPSQVQFYGSVGVATGTSPQGQVQGFAVVGCASGQVPSTVVGQGSAIATNATDGFLYIPTCAGTPTGTPTAQTGSVPMVYDTTNNKFYIYNGGWKGGTNPGTFT